jgi:hypothetical protein
MAQVLGARKRGRKVEPLRLALREAAAQVKATKGTKEVTLEVAPKEPVTFTIPKGAVIAPFHLTSAKNDTNVREQMRLAAQDVERDDLSIRSTAIALDDGTEVAVFHYEVKA